MGFELALYLLVDVNMRISVMELSSAVSLMIKTHIFEVFILFPLSVIFKHINTLKEPKKRMLQQRPGDTGGSWHARKLLSCIVL